MGIACDISEEPQREATKNPKQKATPRRRPRPGDAQAQKKTQAQKAPTSPATARIPGNRPHPQPPQLPEARGHCTRYGALHPIWGATPEQKRCIAYGSGAVPHHTRTNAELATRTTPRHNQPRPQPPALGRIAPQRHKRDRTPLHALLGTASGSMGTPPTLPPIGLTCA